MIKNASMFRWRHRTPSLRKAFGALSRMSGDEIHYYPAKILNLTMGASWQEFRRNLRQFWKFLQFGRSSSRLARR
jgi:hypothetical protein